MIGVVQTLFSNPASESERGMIRTDKWRGKRWIGGLLPVIGLFLSLGYGEPPGASPLHVGTAEVNGTRLYYEIQGEGHPLILVSGGGSLDRRMWDDQFVSFGEYYQVIRYDIRGIGKSDIPMAPYSPVHDLYTLLQFLQVEKAYLLGLSLGGRIAVDFALQHPEMVSALISAAPGLSGYGDDRQMIQALQSLAQLAREEGLERAVQVALDNPFLPATVPGQQKIRQILLENGHLFYLGFPTVSLMQSPNPPALNRLDEIQVPTLIIVGDRDHQEILAIASRLQEGIPQSRKILIPGAGHFINLEKPVEFNQTVLDFLTELKGK
jgi:pimeloyl-ACP methyl ester carboxylesterase